MKISKLEIEDVIDKNQASSSPILNVDCDSQIRAHYRKPCVCRVPRDSPWAKPWAPGKRSICRVQTKAAHGKGKAHGKRIFCRVSLSKMHGKLQAHDILASLT